MNARGHVSKKNLQRIKEYGTCVDYVVIPSTRDMKAKAMKSFSIGVTAACVFACMAGLVAQDPAEFPKPQKEHEWLKQLAGDWDTTAEMKMEGQPAMSCKGTEDARMLGGFWLVSEGEAHPMGMTIQSRMTLGYDTKAKKYVGTWIDSMTEHMWKYEGTLDETGKVLTLNTEGPNFMTDGKLTKFKDVIELKDKNTKILTSHIQLEDGSWVEFMTGTYIRKK